jgi:molecular chaperone GrpE
LRRQQNRRLGVRNFGEFFDYGAHARGELIMANESKQKDESKLRKEVDGARSQTATTAVEDQESLHDRVRAAEKERDDYMALLQTTQADFENYQKRIQRDRAEERRFSHAPFARELLRVLDNLQRALDAADREEEQRTLIQGVGQVKSQLRDTFARFGVTPIEALDQPFDPNLHEAVSVQPHADMAPGAVVQVLEPGYLLHERVLRPAKVVVSAPPTS